MAETLGSLIDKLTIKKIRLLHLENAGSSRKIKQARSIVERQINGLCLEIDDFFKKALQGRVTLREEKVKLYRNPPSRLKLNRITSLGRLADLLSRINKELWDFEDKVRVKGTPYAQIAHYKRQIDRSNKDRNNTIDRIDELLEQRIRQCRK